MLYINDIPQGLPNSHSYLYADDTSIFLSTYDVKKIENVLNKKFGNAFDWLVDNKLSVHFGEGKTECVLFSQSLT